MRTCSSPAMSSNGHTRSTKEVARSNVPRDARGATRFAANPTAKCPTNMSLILTGRPGRTLALCRTEMAELLRRISLCDIMLVHHFDGAGDTPSDQSFPTHRKEGRADGIRSTWRSNQGHHRMGHHWRPRDAGRDQRRAARGTDAACDRNVR